MKLFKSSLLIIVTVLLYTNSSAQNNYKHASWILNGNIYEVNTRQYTSQGTFKAFEKHLPRLKNMGVQTLWFMPIYPISEKNRKGSLGSYYAISNYEAINPEYGTMGDWKALVNKAHAMGFKVIIDWVANHTGTDHYWIQSHPDFYIKDSTGKFVSPYDWTDVYKLNYANPELCDSMTAQMKFWIEQTNVDGFRCDAAGDVSDDFWKNCITELRKEKNIFLLAEGEKASLHKDGFDATYPWSVFNVMKAIVKKEKDANSLDSAINYYDTAYPSHALHMYFTSNHDENSWSKADYETMPGKTHAPFAVLTFTMKNNVPLIYSGQEEPILRAIRFFDKDTIIFSKFKRAAFYNKLLLLRRYHPALDSYASYQRIKTNNDKDVFTFIRYVDKKYVFVMLNLSNKKQVVNIQLPSSLNNINLKDGFNVMEDKPESNIDRSSVFSLEPWGYKVIIDNDVNIEEKCRLVK